MAGCRAAWRIVQYAISQPELQKQCLPLLKKAAENGEIPVRQVAFLTDSILFHSMQPKIYGSIADWGDNGKLTCGAVKEKALLNQRRGLVGLMPIEGSLHDHQLEVMRDGAKPPTNMAEYKRKERMWARKVGWL